MTSSLYTCCNVASSWIASSCMYCALKHCMHTCILQQAGNNDREAAKEQQAQQEKVRERQQREAQAADKKNKKERKENKKRLRPDLDNM